MTDGRSLSVRAARPEELAAHPQLRAAARVDGTFSMVAVDGEPALAIAVVDPTGSAPSDGIPRIHVVANSRGPVEEVGAIEALLAAIHLRLEELGHRNSVIAWDAMDTPFQRRLAEFGYRPGSVWPYFPPENPNAPIEHVMGYRDPVGSVVDLRRDW